MDTKQWDDRYLRIAKEVSGWSKDDAKVGAVIVKDNRIISTGYNGFPTGVADSKERLSNKEVKLELVVHAEMNALLVAGRLSDGATLYVFGKPVCARCAASIIQSGISRVVAPKPRTAAEVEQRIKNEPASKASQAGRIDWEKSGRTAREMFEETKIIFHSYKREECFAAKERTGDNVRELRPDAQKRAAR